MNIIWNFFKKNFLSIFLVVATAIGTYYITTSCSKPVVVTRTVTVVTSLPTYTPTTQEQQIVPEGYKAVASIKPRRVSDKRWEKTDSSIVVSVDSKGTSKFAYTQLDITKPFSGFSFSPKFYVGYAKENISIGYLQGIYRVKRATIDLFITFPYVGAGLGYNITNNFFIEAGLVSQYVQFESIEKIGTYHLDFGKMKELYPILALGFHF